jgi:hypothetical protein
VEGSVQAVMERAARAAMIFFFGDDMRAVDLSGNVSRGASRASGVPAAKWL